LSGIRVTYAGLISLSIRLSSIITGLVFTLIVTRQLSIEEFGTWGLINGLLVYAVVVHPIITYWATREGARGEDSGRMVLLSSSGFSIIGLTVYLILAFFVSLESSASFDILIFAAILIPVMFIKDSLTAINLGHRPQSVSYGFLAFELTKIPLGFIFVYFLDMGLEGAILATFGSYFPSIVVLAFHAKNKLHGKITKQYAQKWLKLFWVPTFRNIPSLLSMSDVIVYSAITGSVSGVAYYSAARTIGFLVNHTRAFSEALYPKLLQTGKKEFLSDNLIKLFYFSFPLISVSIVLAKPSLFALNPIYAVAESIVIILSIRAFLTTLGKVLFQALQGIETVDKDKNSTFRDYAKSKLILYPTFQLIRNVIYFVSLAVILYLFHAQKAEIELVNYWAMVGLIIEIPLIIYIIRLVKNNFTLNLDWSSLFKYLLSSVVIFGLIYFLVNEFLEYNESIFVFLPQLLLFTALGIGGYILLTYVIDKRTRILCKAIIKELMVKK